MGRERTSWRSWIEREGVEGKSTEKLEDSIWIGWRTECGKVGGKSTGGLEDRVRETLREEHGGVRGQSRGSLREAYGGVRGQSRGTWRTEYRGVRGKNTAELEDSWSVEEEERGEPVIKLTSLRVGPQCQIDARATLVPFIFTRLFPRKSRLENKNTNTTKPKDFKHITRMDLTYRRFIQSVLPGRISAKYTYLLEMSLSEKRQTKTKLMPRKWPQQKPNTKPTFYSAIDTNIKPILAKKIS